MVQVEFINSNTLSNMFFLKSWKSTRYKWVGCYWKEYHDNSKGKLIITQWYLAVLILLIFEFFFAFHWFIYRYLLVSRTNFPNIYLKLKLFFYFCILSVYLLLRNLLLRVVLSFVVAVRIVIRLLSNFHHPSMRSILA